MPSTRSATARSLTNQIAGLSFQNAMVLKAGASLNDVEFPPRSSDGVLVDRNGPTAIALAAPARSVGGFFTYSEGLTFSAYDGLNNLLGTATSRGTANFMSSGRSPNELIEFNDASGHIAEVVIAGSAAGASYTMDDLKIDSASNVPEPSSWLLLLIGSCGLWGASTLRLRQRTFVSTKQRTPKFA
jgi:PEP-CTERM motif